MNKMGVIVGACLAAGTAVWAAEGQQPFHFSNSLRLGYDDNVTYADRDKIDSFFITEEISISFDKIYESGFFSLRYRPAVTWYEDLGDSEDQTEWTHLADVTWSQQLTRRLGLTLQDVYSHYDRSSVVDADGALRQSDYSYDYNSAVGALNFALTPKLNVSATARHQMLSYDNDEISKLDDYDILAAGLSLGMKVGKAGTVFIDGSLEDISYDGAGQTQTTFMPGYAEGVESTIPDRGAKTLAAGIGYENTFSPSLQGRVRAGYSTKDMDAANSADDQSPYGELTVTIAPVPTTRLTLGGSYSLYQSGLSTFANQRRTTFSATLAHDLTSSIAFSLIAQYYLSDYKAEDSVDVVDETRVSDGNESAVTAGARISYRINRLHYVDLGYTYTQFDSDYAGRTESERNRIDLGWRFQM